MGEGGTESGPHLESFLLSSDRWKQQLPVLLITATERLTWTEMVEWRRSKTGEEHGKCKRQRRR